MPVVRTITAMAPAKLNLGLAIVGQRADGFHEIVSVFQAIDRCDRLSVRIASETAKELTVALDHVSAVEGVVTDDPGLGEADNLAVRALRLTLGQSGAQGGYRMSLAKAIPTASGMGGASTDAAAAILIAEVAAGNFLSDEDRLAIAATLGSDVPFFLTGGTALVGGRGERIAPLPPVRPTSFVVVFPRLAERISRKTARLFGALRPEDFDAGDDVRRQADGVRNGAPIDPRLLDNGFSRALLEMAPELVDLRTTVLETTGQAAALSGAGPAHYLVEPDDERAGWQVAALRRRLGSRALVFLSRPWDDPPLIESIR